MFLVCFEVALMLCEFDVFVTYVSFPIYYYVMLILWTCDSLHNFGFDSPSEGLEDDLMRVHLVRVQERMRGETNHECADARTHDKYTNTHMSTIPSLHPRFYFVSEHDRNGGGAIFPNIIFQA